MSRPTLLRRLLTIHLPAFLIVLLAVGPFAWLLFTALTPSAAISATGVSLVPSGWSAENFNRLLLHTSFIGNMGHSLIVATGTVVLGLLVSVTAAYAFSRFRFRGRRAGLLTLLLVQLFPQFLAAVALFTLFTEIGEVVPALGLNTILGYSVVLMGGALGQVWLIKGFFDTIPRQVDEAAMIDGAGHATIYFRIILPLARPILAVTGLLAFVAVIGEFLMASIFLTDTQVKTLAVGLYGIIESDRSNNLGVFAAGALMTALPVVLLFQYLQRYIVGGLTAGSVKD
jgi:arabinogalactan oligomer/maltooligosaccharide transport system permease protein